jgi:hypothetical protein
MGLFLNSKLGKGMLLKGLIDHVLLILSYGIPKLDKYSIATPLGHGVLPLAMHLTTNSNSYKVIGAISLAFISRKN